MNFVLDMLFATLRMSAPIVLAAMGGLFAEKSGVLVIGLEGMLLGSSFMAMLGSYLTGSAWAGVLFGAATGILMSLLHGFISITCGGDQTISGAGLILLAQGMTSFGLRTIFGRAGSSDTVDFLPTTDFLRGIPFVGERLAGMSPFIYFALFAVLAAWYIFYKTRFGLRLMMTGDNPRVVETAGVNVWNIRYLASVLCGLFCGLGGAYLSLGQMNLFQENMVAGRGFLAMGAMIMGKWTPIGTMLAALFFGFFDAVQMQLQMIPDSPVPVEFIQIIPFVASLIVLGGFIGRAEAPAARCTPYVRVRRSAKKTT